MRKFLFFVIVSIAICAVGFLLYKDLNNHVQVKNTVPIKKLINIPSQDQNPLGTTTYANSAMNLTFNYPVGLKITQINPQLIALFDPSHNTPESALFIYSTTVAQNATTFPQPFNIPGTQKSISAIPVKRFTAKEVTYSDGTTETILIFAKLNQQFFVIKIPQNSQPVSEAITDIINSINTIN